MNEIVEWLKGGGLVVAASERAAGALAAAYNRARRAEGLTAWPAANILDWQSFIRNVWTERSGDSRMPLTSFQELVLWAEIVGAEGQGTALLEGPRRQLAAMAMDAHRLLCAYAPGILSRTVRSTLSRAVRSTWQQDAAAFSNWLSALDRICDSAGLLSEARLPLELLNTLAKDSSLRPALLLAGFDRILPVQRSVFDAWGEWRETARPAAAEQPRIYAAADATAELAACARWCKLQRNANPHARLLVVTQDVAVRRGEMERAFLRFIGNNSGASLFEFSLGVPLRQVALAKGAHLLLRWLSGAIEEHEIDWLFSTGQLAADAAEGRALAGFMRALRHRGMERTRWRLEDFIAQRPGAAVLPSAWTVRMTRAKRQLEEARSSPADPLSWAELVPRLLQTIDWPGSRSLTSGEYQALRRWQQALDACATLGFNGQRMNWNEFLLALAHALDETLFATESRDAPIQIAGPAESAGLTADAIWMMGASEDKWPAGGSTNPLLPIYVQREAAMPHASPQLDWDLAQAMTARLVASAAEIHFSYARQLDGIAMRPSRLIERVAGPPQPVPSELRAPAVPQPRTERFEDASRVPFPSANALGGSTILTSQSQCPFKAFAIARLNAQGWQSAQAGLTASQRGQLLHSVLHTVWAGKPEGIRSHEDLVAISNLLVFVESHVRKALQERFFATIREFMPQRYLELEAVRLARLVTEWLEYERTRVEFSVYDTEVARSVQIEGLGLDLRLDRIDRLNDGSLLVIDYKSGDVKTKSWELPRPDDVQLPLYAGCALDRSTEQLGGLVFGKIRTGEFIFEGRIFEPSATFLNQIDGRSALVKNKLTLEQLFDWRDKIKELALEFLSGRADVNPRDYPRTCERCDLQALCRIQESPLHLNTDNAEECEGPDNE